MVALLEKAQKFLLGANENDDLDYEDEDDIDIEPAEPATARKRFGEPRDTERRSESPRVSRNHDNVTRLYPEVNYEIVLTTPQTVNDAPTVVNNVRAGNVCIVNLEGVEKEKAQRIADFLAGSSYSLGGSIKRVSNEIFVIAPNGVNITGLLNNEMKSDSTIFSWISGR